MKLLNYIKGLRKGKEAHRLEKESMKDPFLADAIDGYNLVNGRHPERIDALRRQIRAKSATRSSRYTIAWSIAASLLLGVCISSYFLFLKKDLSLPDATLITQESAPVVKVITDTIPAKQTPEKTQQPPTVVASVSKRTEAPGKMLSTTEEEMREQTINDDKTALAELTIYPDSIMNTIVNREEATLAVVSRSPEKSRYIAGKVTDKEGEPIIGASIEVKGTNTGTLSDVNGNFVLKADSNQVLSVQYIGYDSQTIPVDTNKQVLIAMNENQAMLNEVVVTGYGTQRKATLTGATTAVSPGIAPSVPQPVIGAKEYRKYLKEHKVTPTDSICKGVKGEVVLHVIINAEGRPHKISIVKSLCPSADKEAVRLIKEGPDWTYGTLPAEVKVKF